ncbi:MAG TPA: NAD(P)/FAD-dependent oxidoreductase [Sphingobium sp.]|nr:NAD(P)/FAD-dependent oxidoreductase [Sphingobium sp.]
MSAQSRPLTTEEILERYKQEREKRLRPDGIGQYKHIEGVFADFDRDPYTPHFDRDPLTEDVDVVILGAGLSGLMAAARLAEQGIRNVRVIDKAGDFGGTWYWNRYPGAACDVESYIYMPFLEETGYMPTEKYAKAYEIFEHCQRIARHFDLYPAALFQTDVTDLSWNDETSRWYITTDRGDRISGRFAIVAGGVLHKAKLPGIPGMETFKGKSFHTARWDYGYTGGSPKEPMDKLKDKKVALIGTGATSVQIVPNTAPYAEHLYVLQRTPSAVGARGNRPTDPQWFASLKPGWQQERMENFARIMSGQAVDKDLVQDGWTEIFLRNPNAEGLNTQEELLVDIEAMNEIRARIDETVKDPATAEALKPWYNQMCKRPCFHDEYLAAFNRDNVTLLDTAGRGVERITEDAIIVDGKSYPVDCIIYASGFEVGSSYRSRLGFEIHGRGGVGMTDAWAENGPATLYGMHARGFPNLLMFSVTQGGWAINFTQMLGELAIHSATFIRHCFDKGIEQIEPSEAAQEEWFQELLSAAGTRGQFQAGCTPAYKNGEGARSSDPRALKYMAYYGATQDYIDAIRDWRADGLPGMEVRQNLEMAK